jgi:hypothetical protein
MISKAESDSDDVDEQCGDRGLPTDTLSRKFEYLYDVVVSVIFFGYHLIVSIPLSPLLSRDLICSVFVCI